ncbi:3-oxoadipate enol-lactonase [Streptomyces sp. NRRL F-5755]|uniref:bifunctional 3-oxoadipate enol-lactonase/4-carboxymuconolactone decarboxylase PcaDC n=1 Tax=Streptomyces sp. NRRL F-5755 TaxID=1519475 RepID=UPI0006AF60F8|nr:3-oxoadipate enol-lactonase [Streptomyces sp. NRRL F-5755]KOT86741.1 3-oxoadipate enol-lactonase [Streptomyces sp. NRRL F-5755]
MTSTAAHPLPQHREDGPADAPPLILGPSLGTSLAVWEPQMAALARQFRVVRWDLPGHGGTPYDVLPGRTDGTAPTEGTARTVADLAGLVLALADSLGIDRFAYAGISLGGAVGAWLAVHHPERIASLALVCSSARFGEPEGWHERAALVREQGMAAIAETTPGRWFTPAFVGTPEARGLLDGLRAVAPEGYAACCDALATYDLRGDLGRIGAPTLVVAGRDDPATPPAHARELADGIPAASLTELAGAAHLANAERPAQVLAALLGHLAAHPVASEGTDRTDGTGDTGLTDDRTRHAAGTTVRRAVLGDAHVDRATARTTAFTAVFQDFITRYAWGEIWTRPGLSRHTRSCVTITALVARGHHEELELHLRAALRNGLTAEDIQEVLLQSAVYCGVPAANSAFALADRVIAEHREGK